MQFSYPVSRDTILPLHGCRVILVDEMVAFSMQKGFANYFFGWQLFLAKEILGCKLIMTKLSTGLIATCHFHGIRYTKARDTIHRCHGIRYTGTGYDTPISRDTVHRFDGIRYTGFTGYDTPENPLLRPETLAQQAFQDQEKNH